MSIFRKIRSYRISEKQRTIILLILLAFAIGFMFWMRSQYSSNFVDTF